MMPTAKRKAEIEVLADWKKATDKVTRELQLEPLNPTRLSACVGWDEAALITYLGRRDWLQMYQEKLRQWVKYTTRSEVEIKVCRSVWKSYQFYVVIINALIKHTNQAIATGITKQPELFNMQNVQEGELRYVKH